MAAHKKTKKSPEKKKYGTIALTGGGYKGLSLLRWLEEDPAFPKVIFLDYKKPPETLKKTKFYRLDLTETLADVKLAEILKQEKVDTLVHTAFPITPPRSLSRSHELISVGSMYVCNAADAAKVRKLILASTADVYGAFADNPNYLTEKHPARAGLKSRFFADKIDAENRFLKYAKKNPGSVVTILRPATILGPSISSYKTVYFSTFFVPTILGYDPLVQFLHEEDLLRAFKEVIRNDYPGIFNLAGKGIIPLSKAIRLMGKINIPLPLTGLKTLAQILWYLNISPAPASSLEYLKYLWVISIDKAEKEMGFKPQYSCKQALIDFVGAERLRMVKLQDESEV
jgi:UDP-glucose 4-epimerase